MLCSSLDVWQKYWKTSKKTQVTESVFSKVTGVKQAILLKKDSIVSVFVQTWTYFSEQLFLEKPVNTWFSDVSNTSNKLEKDNNELHFLFLLSTLNRSLFLWRIYPAGIPLFKVNNKNTRAMFKTCSKLTIKTPERRHRRCSSVFNVNFEQVPAG